MMMLGDQTYASFFKSLFFALLLFANLMNHFQFCILFGQVLLRLLETVLEHVFNR